MVILEIMTQLHEVAMRNYSSLLKSSRVANRHCLHLFIYISLQIDEIKKNSLLHGTVQLDIISHNIISSYNGKTTY